MTIFFLRPRKTLIFLFLLLPVWERWRVTVWEQNISEIFFCIKVNEVFFYQTPKYSDLFVFDNTVWERSKITVWKQELCRNKQVFSTASVKLFFVRPQNTQIFLFLLTLIWESKRHSLETKHFKKHFFALEVLCMYLPCVKIIFNCISEVFLSLRLKMYQFFRFY